MRDRRARRRKQHILDPAGFELFEPRDDLFGRAEQRRVVEHERVFVVLDPGITLGIRAARKIADVFQHLPADRDRAPPLFLVVNNLQPAGDADRQRIPAATNSFAFVAEHRDPFDDQIGRGDLVEQKIIAFAGGATD